MYRGRSAATALAPAAKLIINNIVKRRYQERVCATLLLLACQHTVSQWYFCIPTIDYLLLASITMSITILIPVSMTMSITILIIIKKWWSHFYLLTSILFLKLNASVLLVCTLSSDTPQWIMIQKLQRISLEFPFSQKQLNWCNKNTINCTLCLTREAEQCTANGFPSLRGKLCHHTR